MAVTASLLDVQSLVSQLMALERKPIDKLNVKIADFQSRISSFGTLKSLISTLQSAAQNLKGSMEAYGAAPADAAILSASATSAAAPGTYTLGVTQLAQAQNLVAAGQTSDTAAISGIDSTVTFNVGGVDKAVSIAAGATLRDVRTAINAADIGMTASIINDGSGSPYRLVLAADETGASKAVASITVAAGGDSAINDLLAYNPAANAPTAITLTQSAAAQDAGLTVNGIAITSASNTVAGAIEGVTLTLKSTTASPTTLTVKRDTEAIGKAAAGFVDAYNSLATQQKSLSAYGTGKKAAGALAGDGTIRQIQDQLRSIFSTPASGGTLGYLAEIGITTQVGGTLKLDSSKLAEALAADFDDVANLLDSATGFATRFDAWAASVVQTGGLIDKRTENLNDTIDNYNTQIDRLEIRMTALQKQYTTTYANLNMVLSSMTDTSNYLQSQFS